jgi:hypothetical protein
VSRSTGSEAWILSSLGLWIWMTACVPFPESLKCWNSSQLLPPRFKIAYQKLRSRFPAREFFGRFKRTTQIDIFLAVFQQENSSADSNGQPKSAFYYYNCMRHPHSYKAVSRTRIIQWYNIYIVNKLLESRSAFMLCLPRRLVNTIVGFYTGQNLSYWMLKHSFPASWNAAI